MVSPPKSLRRGKHKKTWERIQARPTSGTIKWLDIQSLFKALGAKVTEAEGSRVSVVLKGTVVVYHRPHPSPESDKAQVNDVRNRLNSLYPKPEENDDQTDPKTVKSDVAHNDSDTEK